jgi:hypothetical protein
MEISRRTGQNFKNVSYKRRSLGIPNSAGRFRCWKKSEDALLGKAPDAEVAKRLKRTLSGVRDRRKTLHISVYQAAKVQ